jgi:hypothetical protein
MKKGIAMAHAVILIISAIILVVFLFFTFGLAAKLNEGIHDGMCRYSVFVHSTFFQSTKINCERKGITIGSDSIKVDGKEKRVLVNGNAVKVIRKENFDEAVKYALADQMYRCFDIYGRGRQDLMKRDIAYMDVYCFVCADVTFSNDVRGRQISGFADYMDKTKIKQYGIDEEYSKFLASYQWGGEYKTLGVYWPFGSYKGTSYTPVKDQVIDTDDQYMIVFLGTTNTWFNLLTSTVLGTGEVRQRNFYTVNLFKREEAEKACTYLYN